MARNYSESTAQTKWNIDDARMKELDGYLSICIYELKTWQLDSAYTTLESIDMILSGSLPKEQGIKAEKLFKNIEGIRRKIRNVEDDKEYSELNVKLRHLMKELFENFNAGCIQQGFFFRKGKDPRFAALRK